MKHILLADDDSSFRISAAFMLARRGYRVTEAADGKEALQLLLRCREADDRVDLLVTDVNMPLMSGTTLLDQLQTQGVALPVLVITGELKPAVFTELQRVHQLDVLVKPFRAQEFMRYVAALITDPSGLDSSGRRT